VIWLAVLIVSAGSMLFRVSMLFRPTTMLTPRIDRSLSVLAPAVIASMLTAELVNGSHVGNGILYVGACASALGVTLHTKNLVIGAASGMTILWFGIVAGI
jgi:hypothetical protein